MVLLFSRDYLEHAIRFVQRTFPAWGEAFHQWILTQRTVFQERRPDPFVWASRKGAGLTDDSGCPVFRLDGKDWQCLARLPAGDDGILSSVGCTIVGHHAGPT